MFRWKQLEEAATEQGPRGPWQLNSMTEIQKKLFKNARNSMDYHIEDFTCESKGEKCSLDLHGKYEHLDSCVM